LLDDSTNSVFAVRGRCSVAAFKFFSWLISSLNIPSCNLCFVVVIEFSFAMSILALCTDIFCKLFGDNNCERRLLTGSSSSTNWWIDLITKRTCKVSAKESALCIEGPRLDIDRVLSTNGAV